MTEHTLTQDVLKELLHYDPETGIFTWKRRDRKWFKTDGHWKTWNTKNCGNKCESMDAYGYIRIAVFRERYRCHKLVVLYMQGHLPEDQVDHGNGIRSDNRWKNLEECSNAKNCLNKRINYRSKLGLFGLFWYERYNSYQVYINHQKKRLHLGYYEDFFEACCTRKSAELKYKYHENHGRR